MFQMLLFVLYSVFSVICCYCTLHTFKRLRHCAFDLEVQINDFVNKAKKLCGKSNRIISR